MLYFTESMMNVFIVSISVIHLHQQIQNDIKEIRNYTSATKNATKRRPKLVHSPAFPFPHSKQVGEFTAEK